MKHFKSNVLFFFIFLFSCHCFGQVTYTRGRIDKIRLVDIQKKCKSEIILNADTIRIDCLDTININQENIEIKCRQIPENYKRAPSLSEYGNKVYETYLVNKLTQTLLNGLYKIVENSGLYSIGIYFNGTPIHPLGYLNVIEHYHDQKFLYHDVFFTSFIYSEVRRISKRKFCISEYIWDNKILVTKTIYRIRKNQLVSRSQKQFLTMGEMEKIIRNPCQAK